MILEALQQAVVESINQVGPIGEEASTAADPDEQLRHVGCARLRAALLNQAALEARADEGGDQQALYWDSAESDTATVDPSTLGMGWAAEYDGEQDEYYEDYALVLSRSEQATQIGPMGASSSILYDVAEDQELKSLHDAQFGRTYSSHLNSLADTVAALEVLSEAYSNSEDDFEYDVYGDGDYPYDTDGYDFTYDTSSMALSMDEDVDVDRELSYGEDKYPLYEYATYDDYEEFQQQVVTLADAMLSKFELDAQEAEWADYLEQAYEYFTVYLNDDLYLSYSDSYDDADWYIDDAPNPVALLASIAELVVWAHLGHFVLEVRPGYSVMPADARAFDPETVGEVLVIPSGSYVNPAYAAEVFGAMDAKDVFGVAEPGAEVEVVNRFDTQLVYPDGSINWELVTLVVQASATVAMMVGFVVSWLSLRRSMISRWVYVPQRGSGGKGGSGGALKAAGKKGIEWGSDLGTPLTAADCHGAVCWGAPTVEHASNYVSGKMSNDSVAKALCK